MNLAFLNLKEITSKLILFLIVSLFVGCRSLPHRLNKKNTSANFIFGGDVGFGDRYHQHLNGKTCAFDSLEYTHGFNIIRPLLQSADLCIANLETPLSTKVAFNPLEKSKTYLHWCNPDNAIGALLDSGIDIVSLANNHILDQGEDGLYDTIELLESNSIRHYGAGSNIVNARKPLIITDYYNSLGINIYLLSFFEFRKTYAEKYYFYADSVSRGVATLDLTLLDIIKSIKESDTNSFVIINPHWGENYTNVSYSQIGMNSILIDAGADLIIGHGAHRFQAIHNRRGVISCFNLGNLVFNSKGRYAKIKTHAYSFILSLGFNLNKSGLQLTYRMYPILSDNLQTSYQPRFLTKEEIPSFIESLDNEDKFNDIKYSIAKDSFGFHILIDSGQIR